jgi:hypothetical protein
MYRVVPQYFVGEMKHNPPFIENNKKKACDVSTVGLKCFSD